MSHTSIDHIGAFIAYLDSIQPMSSVSKSQLESLCSVVETSKNEDLQSIGKTCKTIYFVSQGIARIYYYKEHNDVTEYFAFSNDILVRAESLFSGAPSNKGIQAVNDSAFIAIPSDALFELFDAHHDLERLFRIIIERSYVDALKRVEQFQFKTAEERYHDLLEKQPHFIQEIPLKHIASYLGITQVSLSRIRVLKH